MNKHSAVYSSPWVPAPVLEACGFKAVPVYDFTEIKDAGLPQVFNEGRCPWSQIFSQYSATASFSAIILATTCDQMRRSAETIEGETPVFVLNVPTTNSPQAMRFYQTEISRLATFLSGISGIKPTSAALIEASARFNSTASQPDMQSPPATTSTPICILGSHLPMPFAAFTKVLGDAGASVVINGLESGPSCTPRLSQLTIDAQPEAIIAQLAETYFASIRDIFRRPNNAFYRWLSTELKRQDPKGVLVVKNSWCDQWTVETVRLREWCKLPVLELEFTSSTLSLSALSRIEAFIETCS